MNFPEVYVKLHRLSAQELERLLERDEFTKWIQSHRPLRVQLSQEADLLPHWKSGQASAALGRSCCTKMFPRQSVPLAGNIAPMPSTKEFHSSIECDKENQGKPDFCGKGDNKDICLAKGDQYNSAHAKKNHNGADSNAKDDTNVACYGKAVSCPEVTVQLYRLSTEEINFVSIVSVASCQLVNLKKQGDGKAGAGE